MAKKFDPRVTCEKAEKAKDLHGYTTKEFSLDSLNRSYDITTPMKVLDMDGLTKETLHLYKSVKGLKVIESPIYIWNQRTWRAIDEVIEGYINDTKRLLGILRLKPKLSEELPNTLTVSSVVFSRNPFEERLSVYDGNVRKYPALNKSNFDTFLQTLYSYSKGMVLVPDIKFGRISKAPPTIPKSIPIITPENYLQIIDEFTNILSERNKKPIFVPIQTSLTKKATEQILNHYKSRGYSNIWINFNCGEVYGRHLVGFRTILNVLDKTYGPEGYCLYCSHLKKEISPHLKDEKAASSDILSQFVGTDFIGCNMSPPRPPPDEKTIEKQIRDLGYSNKDEYQLALRRHKGRIFDPTTYYYYFPNKHPNLPKYSHSKRPIYSPDELIRNIPKNKAIDSILKLSEIENVKELFNKDKKIKDYIKKKDMFIDQKEIFQEISGSDLPPKTKSLFDF